jgi:hypothetical protein
MKTKKKMGKKLYSEAKFRINSCQGARLAGLLPPYALAYLFLGVVVKFGIYTNPTE